MGGEGTELALESAEVVQAIDLQTTVDATLEHVLDVIDAELGALYLLDKRTGRLDISAHRGLSRPTVADLRSANLRVGEGTVGQVVATGQPITTERPAGDGGFLTKSQADHERLSATACVPLGSGGSFFGAVCVGRRKGVAFSPADLRLLTKTVNYVGTAVESARLHDEIRAAKDLFTTLYRNTRLIGDATTRDTVASTLVQAAAELTSSPAALLLLLDGTPGPMRAIAASGLPGKVWRGLVVEKDDPTVSRLLGESGPIVLDDVAAETEGERLLHGQVPYIRSMALVPLRSQGMTTGALVVLHRLPTAYSAEKIEPLCCLADQAATAMERTRLLEASKRAAERCAALSEITKAVTATLDPAQLLKSLAAQVKHVLKYDHLYVGILNESSQTLDLLAVASNGRPTIGNGTRTKLRDSALGWVVSKGQPLVRENLEMETPFAWDGLLLASGIRSDITLPLAYKGRCLGALGLASAQIDAYARPDLELMEQIAGQVAIAVENGRLYQQSIADLRELSALREVVEYFSADLDLDSLLNKIVVAATKLLQADSGLVALANESDDTFQVKTIHNLPQSQAGKDVIHGEGLLGEVLATRQPVLWQNLSEGDAASTKGSEECWSQLAVPIWWQQRLIGIFTVGSLSATHRFGPRDIERLQLLGKHAGVAIENARLYAKSRDLAVAEERNRLARDIHDTIAQSLTGVVLQLEAVADLLESRPEEARQELDEARSLARRSLDDVRQSVWGLHPTPLQGMTVDQAIDREMRSVARQANLSSHFAVRGEERALAPDVETALFRIAQEALSNVRKHASATEVSGTLLFGEQGVVLSIEDDGVGLGGASSSATPKRGFGLTSMRERARLLGGELRVESVQGRGTRLSVNIPYQSAPSGQNDRDVQDAGHGEPATEEPQTASEGTIRVLIADDHPMARQGIRRMLEHCADITVVGEAVDGVEAVELARDLHPDVVLMDLQMPRLNGVEAIGQLREVNPETRVLILSIYDKDEFLFDGIKAGARGYLLKDVPTEELAQAVRAVSRGESLLQGVVAGKLVDRLGKLARGEGLEELTEREMDVLRLLASGARNKEIARQLSIAEKTVKFHVANIFRKMGASSRTETLALAIERGLLHS